MHQHMVVPQFCERQGTAFYVLVHIEHTRVALVANSISGYLTMCISRLIQKYHEALNLYITLADIGIRHHRALYQDIRRYSSDRS